MIIKERPVITWLLSSDTQKVPDNVVKARLTTKANEDILNSEMTFLYNILKNKPNFGLPELLMPSFERIMEKSAPAFGKVMKKLYHEFSENDECGILLNRNNVTTVYGFGGGELFVWYFQEKMGKSILTFAASAEPIDDHIRIHCNEDLLRDDRLFRGTREERINSVLEALNTLFVYVAVKKYVKVETVIIPQDVFKDVDDTPLQYVEKKKVVNQLGQEVIVMDSKWFRKIINDNDIPVRGFFRMQNKKNEFGEWYKELIFVDPFIRHGYHRDAIIEKDADETEGDTQAPELT
ncbi:MAG: hypothetical protein UHP27_03660 [Muribaculaceae bacterium]|nr:hypothetical protein [Muribaculaceae bacterium]